VLRASVALFFAASRRKVRPRAWHAGRLHPRASTRAAEGPMKTENIETRSKNAVRWLVIAILLTVLLIVARYVQG
jgi:hypothetical protein